MFDSRDRFTNASLTKSLAKNWNEKLHFYQRKKFVNELEKYYRNENDSKNTAGLILIVTDE